MARTIARPVSPKVVFEYENIDAPPTYVEGVQGVITPKGALQIHFFFDYMKPPSELTAKVNQRPAKNDDTRALEVKIANPYEATKGEVHLTRRLEANLILSKGVARELHTWLDTMLEDKK